MILGLFSARRGFVTVLCDVFWTARNHDFTSFTLYPCARIIPMLGTVTAPIFSVEMRICPSARKSAAPPPTRPSPGQAPYSRSDPRTSISSTHKVQGKRRCGTLFHQVHPLPSMSSSSPSPANSRDKSISSPPLSEARAFPFPLPPNCDEARISPSAFPPVPSTYARAAG